MRKKPTRLALAGLLTLSLAGPALGETPEESYTRMAQAIADGDLQAMDSVLATGFDVGYAPEGKRSLLSAAIYSGNHAAVLELLAHGADVNRQEGFYQGTAIQFAADADDIEMVDLLLDHGAEIDSRDGAYGDSAINWAAYSGHYDMVKHLLERGADPTIVGHGNALEIAMRRGFQPLVALLAEHLGATHPLSEAEAELASAIEADDSSGVKKALAAGVGVDSRDRFGRPWVAEAARSGRVEALAALIEAGAEIDATDAIGYTALMEAARDGQVECVRLLLARGANPNHVSAERGLALTPLHLGAIGGNVAVVEALVARGARLDVKGTIGTTPLLWGLFEGSTEAAIRLVELGADPTIPTSSGYTAVDFAADTGDEALSAAIEGWRARNPSGD